MAEREAGNLGIPTGHNSLFLDNSSDIGAIEEKIAQAVKLADRYGSVIVICHARPNTAEAWNYRGYATRKLGRTDEGIGYYQRSLALEPNYAKAREYLGEAWMVKGRPDLAKEQLNVIAGICGQTCEEYRDLQAAINGHPES